MRVRQRFDNDGVFRHFPSGTSFTVLTSHPLQGVTNTHESEIAMPNLTLSGAFLGLNSRSYDAFKNDATGETVPGGTTHTLYLWDSTRNEPVAVKVTDARRGMVDGLGQGEIVALSVGVFARGNRLTYSLDRVLDAA